MKQTETTASSSAVSGITTTLAASMLLASLGTSIANVALPTLSEAFSAPFSQVQAVVVAYLAALTVTVILAGRLGDRFGLKRMLIAGLALFLIASLLCATAPDLIWLISARLLQGAGAAFLMTLSMALMRETAGADRLGRAMGLLGTVSALGTALGPSLGGLLIPTGGWRAIFWVQVPLAALALVLALALLPNATGKRKTNPVSLLSVLNHALIPNLAINVLVAAVMMTTLVVGPFYLGLKLGLTGAEIGFVMAAGPVISILSGIPSGRLVDRMGSASVLSIGLMLLAAGSLALAFLPNLFGVTGYLLPVAVLTPGYQLFQAANNTAALSDVPAVQRGTVSGVLNLSRNLGLIAGASLMGMIFASATGTRDLPHASPVAIAEGMRLTFLVATGLILIALAIDRLASWARDKAAEKGRAVDA